MNRFIIVVTDRGIRLPYEEPDGIVSYPTLGAALAGKRRLEAEPHPAYVTYDVKAQA